MRWGWPRTEPDPTLSHQAVPLSTFTPSSELAVNSALGARSGRPTLPPRPPPAPCQGPRSTPWARRGRARPVTGSRRPGAAPRSLASGGSALRSGPPSLIASHGPCFHRGESNCFQPRQRALCAARGRALGGSFWGTGRAAPPGAGGGDRAALAAGGSPGLPLTGRRHRLPVPAQGHAGPAGVRGGPFPMPRSPPSLSSWGPFRGFGGPPLLREVLAPRCQVSTPEQTDISLGSEDLGCRVSGG